MKKFLCILLTAIMAFSLAGCHIQYVEEEETSTEEAVETRAPETTVSLKLWYSDETLTPYLSQCAADYEAANRNVAVTLNLIPESDYVDTLIDGAMKGGSVDLYLLDNDKLEQMKLAGVAADNNMTDIYSVYNYSQKALDACTYKNQMIAYPLTFNTSFVLYNTDLVWENVPRTFTELMDFSDEYEVPAGSNVRTLFSCDLNDIFYNYGFLGGELNIGGQYGDDTSEVFTITEELNLAVGIYQRLIDFFYIDYNSVDIYSCINGFEKGEIVFTVADTSMFARIMEDVLRQREESIQENADSEGDGEGTEDLGLHFGVIPFPDMSDQIASSPLSITTAVVVNPFSENISVAESLAKYITYTNADKLYDTTGYISCRNNQEDELLKAIYASYEKSTPKLKLMYNDEFYALLEVTMHLMAQGLDDVQALSAVGNYLNSHWN